MLPERDNLDRAKLSFFVAGPGPGEGLAIALPRPTLGWIFVDGCKTSPSIFPLEQIWKRYRIDDEPTLGIVLTHPHEDHYEGMLELIDATSPQWLACVATHHPDGGVLRAEVAARRDDPMLDQHPELELALRRVKNLLARIQSDWNLQKSRCVILRDGCRLPIERADLFIDVVAPDPEGTRAFFHADNLATRLRTRANELSAVLHIQYGASRLVLGADLPELDNDVGSRTGWTKVLQSHPDLPSCSVFKIPHHGSDGAMHPAMVGPGAAPEGAIWTLTPFRGGPKREPLPKLTEGKGVAALLRGIARVHLTSLPSGWISSAPLDSPVPLSAINRRAPAVTLPIGRVSAIIADQHSGPFDAVWAFAVDNEGQCVDMYRGDRALQITPAY